MKSFEQPLYIIILDSQGCYFAGAAHKIPGPGRLAKHLDVPAEKRLLAEDQFKAVIFGRIVRTGDHNTAAGIQVVDREIKHRGWPQPDVQNFQSAPGQAFHQGISQRRRGRAAVKADTNGRAASADNRGAKPPAQDIGIVFIKGLADNAANVVFAQNAGMKGVGHRLTGPLICWSSSP